MTPNKRAALSFVFYEAEARLHQTPSVAGWIEKVPNEWYSRFRLPQNTFSDVQGYTIDNEKACSLFLFTDDEKKKIEDIMGRKYSTASAFTINPNTTIPPHLDYSDARSKMNTLICVYGYANTLQFHDADQNVIASLFDVDEVDFHPAKVFHSYKTGPVGAKLLNLWH